MHRYTVLAFLILGVSLAILYADQPLFFTEFFAMDTATKDSDHPTPEAQVEFVKQLGFTGISWTGIEQLESLRNALQRHNLKLYALYLWANIEKDAFQLQPGLESALEQLKGLQYAIWLTINSRTWRTPEPEANQKAIELIQYLAEVADKYNLSVILYPHAGSWLEKTDHAFELAQFANKPNVGLTFNLCHWLKVDGPNSDLELLLCKIAPKLRMVTLNGADPPGDWDRLIQPLDKGSYDLKPLLITLKSIGFTGPVGLQGYGIQEPVKEHLPRSMNAWKQLVQQVSNISPKRISTDDLLAFREPTGEWYTASEALLDPNNEKLLNSIPGKGVLINGKLGNTHHLITKEEFGDIRLHIEFMVPKGSNSGVYFMGRYEIQVLDSWGVAEPKHSDCGGIYQRWHEEPGIPDDQRGYEGRPPRVNASRQPGMWQSFDVIFKAPKFNSNGEKIENAKFVRVIHNGIVVHENQELSGPTRAALFNDEAPVGPIMLQGDHGPVAYRNIWITPLKNDQ